MSTTIDERVVSMEFDNRRFETNVATTMSTLDKLKQALNLTGASKGLETVGETAKNVNMSGLSSAVENIQAKFSALSVVGVTALANITNSAINAGKRIVSALTIDPIKTGFQEYETQINAIQTILANTSHAGTDLDDVNKVLDELNEYADKTIYNFTQMTRNIGTFTAAGVDLDTSASAIQGIANLAAVSGSTSQQASTAMYQLSQAIANGRVNLQDWNSVVNAGMGGKVFQDALVKTAAAMSGVTEETFRANNIAGSFRASISDQDGTGWLTSDILVKTLSQFTLAAEEGSKQWDKYKKSLMDEGYTEKQAVEILKMANTATDAATKVKTLTQLWDTLKESAQSGWTQTWELIMGDFEEAKALLTEVSDTIGAMIGKSADSRNTMIQGWKDLGGRDALIESLRNSFEGVMSIVGPIKEAFLDIFPPITSKQLLDFTKGLESLTEKFKIGTTTADNLKRTFKGVFAVFDMLRKGVTAVTESLFDLSQSEGISSFANFLLEVTASLGDFLVSVNDAFDVSGLVGALSTITSGVSDMLKGTVDGLTGFTNILSLIGDTILDVIAKIWSPIEKVFSWIIENVTIGDVFAGLAGGGVFVAMKKVSGFVETITKSVTNLFGSSDGMKKWKEVFVETIGAVHDALTAFTTGLKIWSIVGVATAITLLTSSLRTISEINVEDIIKSLLAIGVMMTMLVATLKSMSKNLMNLKPKGFISSALSIIAIAKAIDILADAMVNISKLKLTEVSKGLFGIGVALLELSVAFRMISKANTASFSTLFGAGAILITVQGLSDLADALKKFADLEINEGVRGLVTMFLALTEVAAVVGVLGALAGISTIFGAGAILITIQGLSDLADALKKFSKFDPNDGVIGLVNLFVSLAAVGSVTGVLGKLAGISGLFGAGAILLTIQGLSDLADALKKFSDFGINEGAIGLVNLFVSLAAVGSVTGVLGALAGLSGLFGAGAILITIQGLSDLADALEKFSDFGINEGAIGLVNLFVSLAAVGSVTGVLGTLAGLSGLFGAGAILITIQGLSDLADALKKFSDFGINEGAIGLVNMFLSLTEVAAVTGVLGTLAGLAGLFGAGAILLTIQGLDDLAKALKKFSAMSWDEIKRGLVAMGGALGELAVGSLLNTLSGIGAANISKIAEPLGALAGSVKKWKDVVIPENLGQNLGKLASGIFSFTFGGSGASALSTAAPAIGTMAESIKKWKNVSVPEGLPKQISGLSDSLKGFTFKGIAAGVLTTVAPSIGVMADSIKKWENVTLPEGLDTKMKSISTGIKSFSFAFVGGWSLNAIVTPLANLSDSVKKWDGVSIPNDIHEGLTSLSKGVKSFSWAFMGGLSLDVITNPLANLSDSVKKWEGVSVPTNIKDGLTSLAEGVKAFNWAFMGGISLDVINVPLGNFSDTIKKWDGVSIPSKLGDQLTNFANGLKAITNITGIANTSKYVSNIADAIGKFSNIEIVTINSGISDLTSKLSTLSSTLSESVTKSITSARGYYYNFYGAGSYLVSGFAEGITANTWMAEARSRRMAAAAVEAAKDELDEHSPSRVGYEIGDFFGIAFVNAIGDYETKAYDASANMARSAKHGLNDAIHDINNVLGIGIDTRPVISPVLDLSNVKSGVNSIDGMLSSNRTLSVNASGIASVSASMRGIQNGINPNDDVVYAINALRKDFVDTPRSSYNINGISIEEGSDVADAIRTIIRHAKIEGRS